MSKLLSNPKLVIIVAVLGILLLLGVAGGALGNEFGGGFFGSPIANISLKAESIFSGEVFSGFSITNTMVGTWLTILVLLVLSFLATRRVSEVPRGLQNFFEIIIEFFLDLTQSIAGPEKGRRFFPLVMTIFIFVVTANWIGILPGFGTIGRIETAEEAIHHVVEEAEEDDEVPDLDGITLQIFEGTGSFGVQAFGSVDDTITGEEFEDPAIRAKLEEDGKQAGILVPYLRSANTEVNTTLAIALVAMFMVHFWGVSTLGPLTHLGKYLNFKEGPIGLFVGILEAISEVARVISFTFRLFGNIFAGEVLLIAMAFLLPGIGIIPFLGLELFVGVIQAFIFSMLTLVFAVMATTSHGGEEHH